MTDSMSHPDRRCLAFNFLHFFLFLVLLRLQAQSRKAANFLVTLFLIPIFFIGTESNDFQEEIEGS